MSAQAQAPPQGFDGVLAFLAARQPGYHGRCAGWQVDAVPGGANNLLYRVRAAGHDYAVKFTIWDARRRAHREFDALRALAAAGLSLAPRALLLEQARYRQPVVVQSWIAGAPLAQAPATDTQWWALIEHFAQLHQVTPARVAFPMTQSVLTAYDVVSGLNLIDINHGTVRYERQCLSSFLRLPFCGKLHPLGSVCRSTISSTIYANGRVRARLCARSDRPSHEC